MVLISKTVQMIGPKVRNAELPVTASMSRTLVTEVQVHILFTCLQTRISDQSHLASHQNVRRKV